MSNKFKTSFIIVIVIFLVVIIKIALKESIRENASKELESTYTPPPSVDTLPASNALPADSSAPPAIYTSEEVSTINSNSEIETEEITDGIKISRKETEAWILSKLTSYTMESENIFNCNYSFQDGNLVYKYDYKSSTPTSRHFIHPEHNKFSIPINDISKIDEEYHILSITTKNKTMKHYFSENTREEIDDTIKILYDFEREADLTKRLQKAFNHLKTFYKKSNYKEAF